MIADMGVHCKAALGDIICIWAGISLSRYGMTVIRLGIHSSPERNAKNYFSISCFSSAISDGIGLTKVIILLSSGWGRVSFQA